MMLIKITRESVKFIGSKYIPYKYKLTAVHIIPEKTLALHNISLRLLRSVNTLNSKLNSKRSQQTNHSHRKPRLTVCAGSPSCRPGSVLISTIKLVEKYETVN